MWNFFSILLESLRDINEKVRNAALSLNEVLKDMIIDHVNSPKLDINNLVRQFSRLLPKLNITANKDLVLQWILLFDGLPIFNLSDHFIDLYEGLIDLLDGDYEHIMDKFYEKIFLFFTNFRNSRKCQKHFDDLVQILTKTIIRFKKWKTLMGKLYLIMLIFDQISLLKEYLIHFNQITETRPRQLSDHETDYGVDHDKDSEIFDLGEPTLQPTLSKKVSAGGNSHLHILRVQSVQKGHPLDNENFDRSSVPSLMVDIFALILLLSKESEEEMENIHSILFNQFKSLVSELDLNSIINMNKKLVENESFNSIISSDTHLDASDKKIRLVSLNCFQEIIAILKKKLKSSQSDERVLLMFAGIVEFILKEMYGCDSIIMDNIYKLLEEILVIRSDMEEMVCRSLFTCIKSNYTQMTKEKTRTMTEFLQLVLNRINPRIFIYILVAFDQEKLSKRDARLSTRFAIVSDLLDYITVILGFRDERGRILEDMIFGAEFDRKVFHLWCINPFALIKAGLLYLKFDFCYHLLEHIIQANHENSGYMMRAIRHCEDMLAMIETFKYTQMLNSIANPFIKSKIIRFVAALIMVASNDRCYVSLLVKLKKNYSVASGQTGEREDLMIYEQDDIAKFKLYLELERNLFN
jgi:hypothetical protein